MRKSDEEMTLDELFVNRGFSLEQYRTIFYLLVHSKIFENYVSIEQFFAHRKITCFIQNESYLYHNSDDSHIEMTINVTIFLRSLIIIGTGTDGWVDRYSPLIIMVLFIVYNKKYSDYSDHPNTEILESLLLSLDLTNAQIKSVQSYGISTKILG